MVRRGSTVRVRQRALQKPRKSATSRMCSVGAPPPEGVDGAVYGAFASRARLDAPRRSQGMARGGGIAPVALTRSFLRFGERASEVRAPHASPGKVVERPADSAFQARPELAAETHDDFAALAAGAGDEFPCAGAAGVEHVRVDDGLPDGAGLRPVVSASLPEDTEQKQPFRDLGEVCSLLVHTQVLVRIPATPQGQCGATLVDCTRVLPWSRSGECGDGVAAGLSGEDVGEVGVERAALQAAGLVNREQPLDRALAALGAAAE